MISRDGQSFKEISEKFEISHSTLTRIVQKFESHRHWKEIFSKRGWKLIESPAIQKHIDSYLDGRTHPFTAKDISLHIYKVWRISLSEAHIRKFLKQERSLSFKKGSARPVNLVTRKQKILQSLFSVYLAKKLNKIDMLVNVDEATFSRNTKAHYSWLKRGKSCFISNISLKGSISIISWIMTNGVSLSASVSGRINSKVFAEYLDKLFKYVETICQIPIRRIWLILDNCAVHRSKKIKEVLREKECHVWFLPQYSPELAPIEMYFGRLKKEVVKVGRDKLTDLGQKEGIVLLNKAIQTIKAKEVISYWDHFKTELIMRVDHG
jgi:transposase